MATGAVNLIRFGLDKFGCVTNKAEMEILHATLGLHGNGLQHLNTYLVAHKWKMLCGNVFIVILGIPQIS